MFERCPLKDNRACPYAGYDKNKELRCGFATHPNKVRDLKVCGLELKKAKRKKAITLVGTWLVDLFASFF